MWSALTHENRSPHASAPPPAMKIHERYIIHGNRRTHTCDKSTWFMYEPPDEGFTLLKYYDHTTSNHRTLITSRICGVEGLPCCKPDAVRCTGQSALGFRVRRLRRFIYTRCPYMSFKSAKHNVIVHRSCLGCDRNVGIAKF